MGKYLVEVVMVDFVCLQEFEVNGFVFMDFFDWFNVMGNIFIVFGYWELIGELVVYYNMKQVGLKLD